MKNLLEGFVDRSFIGLGQCSFNLGAQSQPANWEREKQVQGCSMSLWIKFGVTSSSFAAGVSFGNSKPET
jgi:hypothetical protein